MLANLRAGPLWLVKGSFGIFEKCKGAGRKMWRCRKKLPEIVTDVED